MTVICACGRPTRDQRLLCSQCAWELERALAEVPALVDELTTTLTRQGSGGYRNGSRSTDKPLPFDVRASDCLDQLRVVLVGWTRVIAETHGHGLPIDSLPGMARFLFLRSDLLVVHEAADEISDEIGQACRDGWRIVDRPADRLFAGICGRGGCLESLYAKPKTALVTCRTCGTEHDVDRRRGEMRADIDGMLLPIGEIARLGAYFDGLPRERTRNLLTTWATRGRIVAHGLDRRGRETFPFGESIAAVLAAWLDRVPSGSSGKAMP